MSVLHTLIKVNDLCWLAQRHATLYLAHSLWFNSPLLRLFSSPHTWPHSVDQYTWSPLPRISPGRPILSFARLFSRYPLDLALDTVPAVLRESANEMKKLQQKKELLTVWASVFEIIITTWSNCMTWLWALSCTGWPLYFVYYYCSMPIVCWAIIYFGKIWFMRIVSSVTVFHWFGQARFPWDIHLSSIGCVLIDYLGWELKQRSF